MTIIQLQWIVMLFLAFIVVLEEINFYKRSEEWADKTRVIRSVFNWR